MPWKDELRAELLSVCRVVTPTLVPASDETDAARRDALAEVFETAAKVMRFTRSVLKDVGIEAKCSVAGGILTFTLGKRFLEVSPMLQGLVLKVARETGTIDLLHIENGEVVDGNRRPIPRPQSYFTALVVTFVGEAAGQATRSAAP